MKLNRISKSGAKSRALKYGSVSAVLSVLLIAAIILVNVIFTMLADKYLWYVDMTQADLYTLSDACYDLLADVSEDVTIYFCDQPDNLDENTTQRLVHHTALELANKMSNIHVVYLDIWKNPSSVDKFKRSSDESIYSTSVIFESGTEWATYALRSFFTFSTSTDDTPWAYSGEKTFSSAILSVTRTESPIACVTMNHGETFNTDASALLNVLSDTGYRVQSINLATDEIPEDCRLIVVYNPTDDFIVKEEGISDISEIAKLDQFLDGLNAMMVFMNPDNPVLPNFEEYLEEWGIKFLRYTDNITGHVYSEKVKDSQNALTQDGLTIIGEYTTEGLGASIHKDMRAYGSPAKVIFKNVMPIVYPDRYKATTYHPEDATSENDTTGQFSYGIYSSSSGVNREIHAVFTSYSTAETVADGKTIEKATETEKFRLMTVTREQRMIDNSNADSSYVWACGSIDFAKNAFLQSNTYGNTDLLMYSMHTMGKEYVPTGLEFKIFDNTTIEGLTTAAADQYTWSLIIIPPAISFVVGSVVIIRRKYS